MGRPVKLRSVLLLPVQAQKPAFRAGPARAIGRWEKVDDSAEPMSYRLAVWGLLGGMVVFGGFWLAAGMSLIWVVVILLVYLLLSLSITRVRAEAGGQHNVWDLEPMNLMRLFDSHVLGPGNLAMAAASHWYWRLSRSHPMPSQFEAFKLAQENGMKLSSLIVPMLAAFAIATFHPL